MIFEYERFTHLKYLQYLTELDKNKKEVQLVRIEPYKASNIIILIKHIIHKIAYKNVTASQY